MSFLQHLIILFIVILIDTSYSSTIATELTTDESMYYEQVWAETRNLLRQFKEQKKQFESDRKKFRKENQISNSIKNTDVIRLNVGGEIMMTTRETLTHIQKSILSIMFNGRWEQKLQIDKNGFIFLDFDPILFRHLLDQLQAFDTINISPPSQPSLVIPFKKMLKKLGLDQQLALEKNLITFNVGGHIMINQHTTFTQVINSTFDTILSSSNITDKNNQFFIDNNPKLFQHLVNQLREESSKNICSLTIPTNKVKIVYERMINDLGLCLVEGNDTKDSVDSSFWPDLGPQYHKDLWKAVNELKQNSSTQQEEISALHKKDTEQQQTLEVQQQSITEQKQKFVDQEQKLSAQQKVLSELPTFCQGRTHYNQWVPYSLTTIGIKVYVNTSHCQFKTVPQYFTSLSGIASHWRTMGATSIYDETANGFTVDLYPGEKNYETGVETLATMPTMKWELNWIGIKSKN